MVTTMPEYLIRWVEDDQSNVAPYWSFDADSADEAINAAARIAAAEGRRVEAMFVEVDLSE